MKIERKCLNCSMAYIATTTKELQGGICDICAGPSEELPLDEDPYYEALAEALANETAL